MKFLFASVLLLLVSASAHAQRISTMTGNDLLESCGSAGHFGQAFCLGYVAGVTDLDGPDGSAFPERRRSCVAENVSNGQVRDVVVKYLKDHPEERHIQASILIVKAMAQAFPCKTK
jgi:hypothetical protein